MGFRYNIVKLDDGAWKFEKNGINLILDGYKVVGNKHVIINPSHAICYFNIEGSLYGVSNQYKRHTTVEDFFEVMQRQYAIFIADKESLRLLMNRLPSANQNAGHS